MSNAEPITSKDEVQDKPASQDELREEVTRGYIRSMFDEYPGYIQFPFPLMLHHVDAWWKEAVDKNKDIPRENIQFHRNQWHAYRNLLIEYDGWHLENIPIGDVKNDNVPAIIVSFILQLGEQYVLNQLSPKVRGVLRSII
jgi:hypothetical protein